MKKITLQGATIILLFFTTWFLLDQVDWMTLFEIEKNTEKTEEKLGELYLEIFTNEDSEITEPFVIKTVDSIISKICSANDIDHDFIKMHIIDHVETNAFALPNGHLILYNNLIRESESPEALSGVIAHEIAHIEGNHVMKKLIKEVGLSVLISITTGNGGGQIIKETAKTLSSTAFDRGLEKEADLLAVDYLVNAQIDPEPFASFLYALGSNENEMVNSLTWLRTHPDSEERAKYIIEYSENLSTEFKPVIMKPTWDKLKVELKKD